MASLPDLERALINADKAGDVDAAKMLAAEITKVRGAQPKPVPFVPSGEKGIPKNIFDFGDPEVLAANPLTRFAYGAAEPILGLGQLNQKLNPAQKLLGLENLLDPTIKRMDTMIQRGRERIGDEGLDAERMAGNVLSPANLATAKLPLPKTLPGRMAQGATIGGVAGASMPVTNVENFQDEKAMQVGTGVAVGGAIPPLAAAVSKVGNMGYHGLIEPWANPAAIKGRAYLGAAGNKADEIIDLLTRNKQIVPGSEPTAGQATVPAGRAEFAALQKSAEKVAPSEYLARSDKQSGARLALIDRIAGTQGERNAEAAARSAAAGPLYKEGFESVAKGAPTAQASGMDGFRKLMERPSMKAAIKRAETLAAEKGQKLPVPSTNRFLPGAAKDMTGDHAQAIKLAFDDMIAHGKRSGIETAELTAMLNTRRAYLDWMEAEFPALKAGRAAYKEGSQRLNQIDVGKTLKEKLQPALSDDAKQRAGVFAEAVRNAPGTLKKATGEPRFQEMDEVLSPRQLRDVSQVQDDLAQGARFEDMARRGAGTASAQTLATANLEAQAGGKMPNLLHRGAMMANAIISRLEGKVNRRLAAEMAAEMLDPPTVATALRGAQAQEARNKKLVEAILRQMRPATAGAAAAAVTQGD